MNERYAVYYAPATQSPLWRLASRWLGRDAATGTRCVQPATSGITPDQMWQFTQSARRYGFHATLKPPMRLRDGIDAASLKDALDAFARNTAPVDLGLIEVDTIGGFLALVPRMQDDDVTRFAADCVREFDIFRAPPTEEEIERRRSAGLTERQRELLEAYGYPYVMEEFRLHLTLSDRLDRPDRDALKAGAAEWFGPVREERLVLDRVCLFREPEPDKPFERLADFPLTGAMIKENVA